MDCASKRIVLFLAVVLWGTGFSFAQNGYGTTFAADIAFPTASFGESFKTGFGGHVDFYMESSSNLRLSLLGGFTTWNVDEEQVNQRYAANGGNGTLQLTGRMNAYPILLGAKLLSPPGNMRFYGLLEVGVYFYSGKVEGQKLENGVVTQNIYESLAKTVAGGNLGVGFLMPIGKDVSLDLAARYHLVKRDTYYNYDVYGNPSAVNTDKYFTIAVGVTYSFLAQ
jgi:hypothetical protein